MKKLLLITVALALNFAHAQELKFTLGPSVGDFMGVPGFLNVAQGKSYAIFHDKKGLEIKPIEEYLKPGEAMPIRSEMMTLENVGLERWLTIGNTNYLVYSVSDKKKDELTVYLQELSVTMTLLGSAVKLATFTNMKDDANKVPAYLARYAVRTNFIHVYASYDGKRLVMLKQRKTKVEMKAFELDKGPLGTKTFDLVSSHYELTDCRVANDGNIYVLGENENGFPFLIAHNFSTGMEKNVTISTGDKIDDFGYNLKLLDETAYLVGLSDIREAEGSGEKQVGYQVLKVNPSTLALERVGAGKVNESYAKYMRKLGSRPQLFSVRNVILRDDGSIVFSIEGAVAQVNKEYGWTTWIYSALGVIALDKTGAEQWNIVIEKEQVQGDDTYVGHSLLGAGSNVYVLYNDNSDNFDLLPTVKPKERALNKKIYVCVAEIDETGKAKKLKPLTVDKKKFSAVEIRSIRKIKDDLYQMFLKMEQDYFFATLSIK